MRHNGIRSIVIENIDALVPRDKNLDAPFATLWAREESLTHAVISEEVPPSLLLCELPKVANFEPVMVTLVDPEAGGREPAELTKTGAMNDMAFVINDLKPSVSVIGRFGPQPALDLETMADSEIHT